MKIAYLKALRIRFSNTIASLVLFNFDNQWMNPEAFMAIRDDLEDEFYTNYPNADAAGVLQDGFFQNLIDYDKKPLIDLLTKNIELINSLLETYEKVEKNG